MAISVISLDDAARWKTGKEAAVTVSHLYALARGDGKGQHACHIAEWGGDTDAWGAGVLASPLGRLDPPMLNCGAPCVLRKCGG